MFLTDENQEVTRPYDINLMCLLARFSSSTQTLLFKGVLIPMSRAATIVLANLFKENRDSVCTRKSGFPKSESEMSPGMPLKVGFPKSQEILTNPESIIQNGALGVNSRRKLKFYTVY